MQLMVLILWAGQEWIQNKTQFTRVCSNFPGPNLHLCYSNLFVHICSAVFEYSVTKCTLYRSKLVFKSSPIAMQCIDLKLKRAARRFWKDAAGRPMVSLVFETHLPLMSLTGRDSKVLPAKSAKCRHEPPGPGWALKFPSPFQPGKRRTVGR